MSFALHFSVFILRKELQLSVDISFVQAPALRKQLLSQTFVFLRSHFQLSSYVFFPYYLQRHMGQRNQGLTLITYKTKIVPSFSPFMTQIVSMISLCLEIFIN